MQGKSIIKNSVKIVLCIFLLLVLVHGVQAAETYQYVTRWGSQATVGGQSQSPEAVAIDNNGNVYVTYPWISRVEKYTPNGQFILGWGSKGTQNGQFNQSNGIAVDSQGNVYVTDRYNHRVQKFTSSGTFLMAWGSFGTGNGQFNDPFAVAVDSTGNVYVTDHYNHRVQKFSPSGQFITAWGGYGNNDGQFNIPLGIAVDASDNVYVVDYNSYRIQKFTPSGQFITKWEGPAYTGETGMKGFIGVTLDSAGYVYVSELWDSHVYKFSPAGTLVKKFGGTNQTDWQFANPISDIAVDSSGNLYFADRNNARIQKFAPVSPSAYNFTGSWTMGGSNGVWGFGNCMALRQSGTQVSGDYTHENGMVTGTVSGNTLSGVWAEEPTYTGDKDSGRYVVTMSTDGQSFSGTFGYGSSSTGYSFTGTRTSTVCPVPAPTGLSVTGITPSTAPNSGPVGIIDLSGSGFPQTVSVKLTRWGSQSITASGITVVSQSKITCNFDLTGKDVGTWDVVVTKPDGLSATLPNGFTITAQPGAVLSITSYPTGADLFIDGVQRGTTPATFTDILPGVHSIAITKPGYYGYNSEVSVTAGQTTPVDVTLQQLEPGGTGSISIASTPKDIAVYLDGNYKGLGLTVLSDVGPGYHSLKLTKSNYNDFGKDVYVTAGVTTSVIAVLQPVATDASISASSTPTGAAVYLDGDYKGLTPTQIGGVKPGYHIVSFKKDGYTQTSQSITVAAGEKKTVSVNLIIIKKECWVDLGVVCLPGFESVIAVIALLSVVAIFRRK